MRHEDITEVSDPHQLTLDEPAPGGPAGTPRGSHGFGPGTGPGVSAPPQGDGADQSSSPGVARSGIAAAPC